MDFCCRCWRAVIKHFSQFCFGLDQKRTSLLSVVRFSITNQFSHHSTSETSSSPAVNNFSPSVYFYSINYSFITSGIIHNWYFFKLLFRNNMQHSYTVLWRYPSVILSYSCSVRKTPPSTLQTEPKGSDDIRKASLLPHSNTVLGLNPPAGCVGSLWLTVLSHGCEHEWSPSVLALGGAGDLFTVKHFCLLMLF